MIDKIIELIEKKEYVRLKEQLDKLDSVEITEIIGQLEPEHASEIFRLLESEEASWVLTELSNEQISSIIDNATDQEVKEILDEMYIDDMVDFIEELPEDTAEKIIKNTSAEDRVIIDQIMNYPPKSAGSLMTTEFVILNGAFTVKEALDYINKNGEDKITIYTCYVTDSDKRLIGFLSLRMILTSDPDLKIADIMHDDDIVYVKTFDKQEEVSEVFKKYGYNIIPVVDEEKRLVGIITVDDIIDVIEEEDTEDFHAMAGISPSEVEYSTTPFYELAKNRLFWLLLLMITAMISGGIIDSYGEVLASYVILNSFIPMLMGTGGNTGNQSSTLIIRGLATGEVELKDWFKVFVKEFKVSIFVGLILAIVNFLRIVFISKIAMDIALVVSLTMFFTIVLSTIVGALLPIVAEKFNLDPAVMAAPLITTIVDAACLIVFFNIAAKILGI